MFGQVKRLWSGPNTYPGKILIPHQHPSGYLTYDLWHAGRVSGIGVQRLVALAFLGVPPDASMEAAHKDGNPQHNHVSNIYWATHQRNNLDRFQHGTMIYGEQQWKAKLTAVQVVEMRELHAREGVSAGTLASRYGVDVETIRDVLLGKSWRQAGGIHQAPRSGHIHSAKVTPEIVRAIRQRFATSSLSYQDLTEEFGVPWQTIKKIVRRETWTHLDQDIEKPRAHLRHQGATNAKAKLTDDDIRLIRTLYQQGGWTYATLATRFAVTLAMIGNIIKRRNWTHVPDDL
jgi:transposase